MAEAGTTFGSCCEELKEALEGGDFEPLITVGQDEVIYMTVGLVDLDEEEPGLWSQQKVDVCRLEGEMKKCNEILYKAAFSLHFNLAMAARSQGACWGSRAQLE